MRGLLLFLIRFIGGDESERETLDGRLITRLRGEEERRGELSGEERGASLPNRRNSIFFSFP